MVKCTMRLTSLKVELKSLKKSHMLLNEEKKVMIESGNETMRFMLMSG